MKHYYVIGDLHGDFKPIRDFVQRNIQLHRDVANGDENILICLGDFGANYFFDYRDENFKKKLSKYPFTYFVIRGNHEQRPSICMENSPAAWHYETMFDNQVMIENDHPHIKYALDIPSVYNIGGALTLIIPGAYSVDKDRRIMLGWSWFDKEQLTKEEMDIGKQLCEEYGYSFDLILSHTCPLSYEPKDLFLDCINQNNVDKTMETYLEELDKYLRYELWLFGHYHDDRVCIHPLLKLFPPVFEYQHIMLFHKVFKLDEWLAFKGTKIKEEYII